MANLLNYNTTGLTGSVTITDKQGSDLYHFIVTITGNSDGTFTDLKATYVNSDGYNVTNAPFNVSGKVGTLIVDCYKADTIKITGKFAAAAAITGPKITNNILNTTAKAVASETGYTITVDGTAQGMFNGIPKISYGGNTYDMTVTNQTATIIVPINTETVIINGDYLLGDYIEVTYGLTNCEIVGDKPVKIKTGQSYTFNFIANNNSELTQINVDLHDDLLVSKSGTISADKHTATITFDLPSGSKDLFVHANADVVQPPEIKNYGAINVYVVTLENLNEFAKKRFFKPSSSETSSETYLEINLGQYVNRIKRIFTSVPVGGDDVLKCGNYNTEIQVKNPKSDVVLLNFGNVEISGTNGNNEDYNADIKMFIPCKGFVSVDSKYIGKIINLSIKVNVITGDAVAFISCDGVTFNIESFSLSRDVIYRSGTDLNVNGGAQWNEEILYGLKPYILITENITINVPINNTQENVTLKDVNGFSQFENVNLNNANILVDEYNDIINQLERGVYL